VKKTIKDIDVSNKRVLVRVDFNVPFENGKVADATRIRAALPTIRELIDRKARVILCSHLGRPKGKVVDELRLDPVAEHLSDLLSTSIPKADDCIGEAAVSQVHDLKAGEVLLLENTRFHSQEEANDPDFAKKLASLADIYVNDAFAAAHRAHASTEGVAHHLPAVAGLLMERELIVLEPVRENPEHPFMVILGGAKVSLKIGMIKRLLEKADEILVGGGIGNTFLKAKGVTTGDSLVEEEQLDAAEQILEKAGDSLILPEDAVIADSASSGASHQTAPIGEVPSGWQVADIGPQTVKQFKEKLDPAKMVVWNGPLGVFETEPFAQGTFAVARVLAELEATTIVGGGDSAAAVNDAGVSDRMSHVSTGGGAFLSYMEGKEMPALSALD